MDIAMGTKILGEVEEVSMEEVINDLRASLEPRVKHTITKQTFLPGLDDITASHFQATREASLSLTGRRLPLLYHIITHLLSAPHSYTVLLIDLEARFDATKLTCQPASLLDHLYILRPAYATASSTTLLRALVVEASDFMIYGNAAKPSASGTRPWWGTVVVGGQGAGDITAGWKGWLRVDKEQTEGFSLGISAEEALTHRQAHQEGVDNMGWSAASPWGEFKFRDRQYGDESRGSGKY